jgi:hypothetical protein
LHALLVGIDRYQEVRPWLSGCSNDVDLAAALLRERVGEEDLHLRELRNEEATRDAVIDAFREHLGQAGPEDTALFWFCGHGSTSLLPKEIWYAEESGTCQTLICYDSRSGDVPDLYDKELAVLADEVRGAMLVSILDSCHSRSGLRGQEDGEPALPPRLVSAALEAPAPQHLLPELLRAAEDPSRPLPGARAPRHVALAACQEHQLARERYRDGVIHGVFSHAIGRALSRVGPEATYRQVWSHAGALVQEQVPSQSPAIETADPVLADREFLGGELHRPAAGVTMRHFRGAWEVDVGTLHGLVWTAGEETRLAVLGARPLLQVRVVRAGPLRSGVEPVDWVPDVETQYRMVITEVPFPPVTVVVPEDSPVAAGIRTAGECGGPSPHVRVGPQGPLRVSADQQIIGAGDRPLTDPVPPGEAGVRRVVGDLEHIARWMQVRSLRNPRSALDGRIHLEIVEARPGERVLPADRAPITGDRIDLHYRRDDDGWKAPSIFVRVRNSGPDPLYCALLDLTDRFRMDPDLFDGAFVRAQWSAVAGRGGPIRVTLPPDRPVVPGASVTDWLLLLASDQEFSSEAFHLPRLGEVARAASAVRSAGPGLRGVLGRLGLIAARRDLVGDPDSVADWTAEIVRIRATVPGGVAA